MSSQAEDLAAPTGDMQQAIPMSGPVSAGPPLPKMHSWGATGLQGLFKQPSAGGTNFADLLADPAEGDAGASPLFKWTSDGSMMEELMKVYKESSPGTPTFGQQGSLSRDNSFKEHPLFKDGSFTASLQAAFHSHLEDVEEQSEAEQAESADQVFAPASNAQQAVLGSEPSHGLPTDTPPFSFSALPMDSNDSPQLHVASLELGPQPGHIPQPGRPLQSQAQLLQTDPNVAQPSGGPAPAVQLHVQVPTQQAEQHQAQHAQQAIEEDVYSSMGFASGRAQTQQYYPAVSYPLYHSQLHPQPSQVTSMQPQQIPQSNVYLQAQQQPAMQQGSLDGQLGSAGLSRTIVTSGAMGAHSWSRPNSRPSSGSSQKSQGSTSGSRSASHQVQSADGSMQAIPRIIVRSNTPPQTSSGLPSGAPTNSAIPQQQPVVLQSKVLNPTGSPQTSMGSADTGSRSGSYQQSAAQLRPNQAPSAGVGQYQQPVLQYEQLHSLPMQQQALPAQYYTQQAPQHAGQAIGHSQHPHYQQHQHQQPQTGSFQELLSAPVFPDRYNSAPVPQEFQAHAHQAQTHQPITAVPPGQFPGLGTAAAYSSQVLQSSASMVQPPHQQVQRQFPASTHSVLQNAQQPLSYDLPLGAYPQLQTSMPLQYGAAVANPTGLMHGARSSLSTSSGLAANAPQPMDRHSTIHHMAAAQPNFGHQQQHQHQQQQQQHYQQLQQPQYQQPQYQQHHHQHPHTHAHTLPPQLGQAAYQPGRPSIPAHLGHDLAQSVDGRSTSLSSVQSNHSAQQPGIGNNSAQPHWQPAMQQPRLQQQPGFAVHQPNQTMQALPPPAAEFQQQYPIQGTAVQQSRSRMLDALGLGQADLGQGPGQQGQLQQPLGQGPGQQGQSQRPLMLPGRSAAHLLHTGLTTSHIQNPAVSGGSSDVMQSQGYSSGSWQDDPGPHGSVVLTSRPAAPEVKASGKVVSFAPDPTEQPPYQHQAPALAQMPRIPGQEDTLSSESGAKENNDQGIASSPAPPVPSGRKFKRDRSSKNNSFSLPPMPPKKPATAVADFSPASSLEFGLHGAASAPIPQDLAVPEEAAPVRHIMSCQDLSLDDIGASNERGLEAAGGSSGAHSSDKSADLVLTAECTIDFTSAVWKAMSRKEKNRASAAASRARREAYTESLEDKVRKLQEEHDWLQNQIAPGSVADLPAEDTAAQPNRPPIRHLSF